MTEEKKSQIYGMLLSEHTRIMNRINEIKGESIDLNLSQLNEIQRLESLQVEIMKNINSLLSR